MLATPTPLGVQNEFKKKKDAVAKKEAAKEDASDFAAQLKAMVGLGPVRRVMHEMAHLLWLTAASTGAG